MRVKDVMTMEMQLVDPDTTVEEAGKTMRDQEIDALPVYENHHIVGMVTMRDIDLLVTSRGYISEFVTVRSVMNRQPAACPSDWDVRQAERYMDRESMGRLLVKDADGYFCGLVSRDDLMAEGRQGKRVRRAVDQLLGKLSKTKQEARLWRK